MNIEPVINCYKEKTLGYYLNCQKDCKSKFQTLPARAPSRTTLLNPSLRKQLSFFQSGRLVVMKQSL